MSRWGEVDCHEPIAHQQHQNILLKALSALYLNF